MNEETEFQKMTRRLTDTIFATQHEELLIKLLEIAAKHNLTPIEVVTKFFDIGMEFEKKMAVKEVDRIIEE